MFINDILIGLLGWGACLITYLSIHRYQIIPVLASAASSMFIILIAKSFPSLWDLDNMLWHAFWFGSSFCGMNNNQYVSFRTIHFIWLLYAVFFAYALHYMPLPGGFLGSLAFLASGVWVLTFHCLQLIKRRTEVRRQKT